VNTTLKITSIAVMTASLLASVLAQSRPQQKVSLAAKGQTSAAAKDTNTPGRVAKFSSTKTLSDANITEDDNGNIGIGTNLPTSLLTVSGVIEMMSAQGGLKFPDGTVQTTAGLATASHDGTLSGNGTAASPLRLAVPLKLNTFVQFGSVLEVSNGNVASHAITATGGADGGIGLRGFGTDAGLPGNGVLGVGGASATLTGGFGVGGAGGAGDSGSGGTGVSGGGGSSNTGTAGSGVEAGGGRALISGNGGRGVRASGGTGRGAGKSGGHGIETFPGIGEDGAVNGLAGKFNGNVQVTGTLSKAGGSFKIDHPLDPENKYLSHSFVESPDMKNIYDGVASLDNNGEAIIEMPEWFGALNRDFRYLLTALGAPMPGLFISQEIVDNRFKISGGMPGMKVSWQITGVRHDAWANKNRIPVEEPKSEKERGHYLHPEAFGQAEGRGVDWANEPEQMRQLKQLRLETEQSRRPHN
jgi:hypothetical protein